MGQWERALDHPFLQRSELLFVAEIAPSLWIRLETMGILAHLYGAFMTIRIKIFDANRCMAFWTLTIVGMAKAEISS